MFYVVCGFSPPFNLQQVITCLHGHEPPLQLGSSHVQQGRVPLRCSRCRIGGASQNDLQAVHCAGCGRCICRLPPRRLIGIVAGLLVRCIAWPSIQAALQLAGPFTVKHAPVVIKCKTSRQ